MTTPERLVFPKEVQERTQLSRATIWRMQRDGKFPAHRQLSPGRVCWLESEIAAWIQALPVAACMGGENVKKSA